MTISLNSYILNPQTNIYIHDDDTNIPVNSNNIIPNIILQNIKILLHILLLYICDISKFSGKIED